MNLKRLKNALAKILVATRIIDKMIVLRVDGGICSQMHFYLLGRIFAEKGYKVKYHLCWFKEFGHDMNGLFARNFDLLKAFPSLEFKEASKVERYFYEAFKYNNNYLSKEIDQLDYLKITPPAYLTGYYWDPAFLYTDLLPKYFKPEEGILDDKNMEIFEEIRKKDAPIAIHIRRGDLSTYNRGYGEPASNDYFKNAINYIDSKEDNTFYYLFSDEPDWVKSHLIHDLPICDNYRIVDINGSDKGYMDLYLMAACKHVITSKGSLGKYGAFMTLNDQKIIIVMDDEVEHKKWQSVCKNIVFLK